MQKAETQTWRGRAETHQPRKKVRRSVSGSINLLLLHNNLIRNHSDRPQPCLHYVPALAARQASARADRRTQTQRREQRSKASSQTWKGQTGVCAVKDI